MVNGRIDIGSFEVQGPKPHPEAFGNTAASTDSTSTALTGNDSEQIKRRRQRNPLWESWSEKQRRRHFLVTRRKIFGRTRRTARHDFQAEKEIRYENRNIM